MNWINAIFRDRGVFEWGFQPWFGAAVAIKTKVGKRRETSVSLVKLMVWLIFLFELFGFIKDISFPLSFPSHHILWSPPMRDLTVDLPLPLAVAEKFAFFSCPLTYFPPRWVARMSFLIWPKRLSFSPYLILFGLPFHLAILTSTFNP